MLANPNRPGPQPVAPPPAAPSGDWWDTNGLAYAPVSSVRPGEIRTLQPSGFEAERVPGVEGPRIGITDPGQGGNKVPGEGVGNDPSGRDPYAESVAQAQRILRGSGEGKGGQNYGDLSDPAAWMGLVNDPVKLRAWVKQGLGPTADDELIDYYAGKVKGQPGADLNEQKGSAGYWLDKMKNDPKITGKPLEGGGSGWTGGLGVPPPSGVLYNPNDLTAGFTSAFQAPSAQQARDTPGYEFALEEGLKGIDRGAASRGTLLTMGNQKDRAQYATGLADQTYSNTYNRAMSEYKNAFDIFNSNQGNLFNRNLALSGQGLSAAGGAANAASNVGQAGQAAYDGKGNAQAAGAVQQGNANSSIASSIGEFGLGLANKYFNAA